MGSFAARDVVPAVTNRANHHRALLSPSRTFRTCGEDGRPFQSHGTEYWELKPVPWMQKGKSVKEAFLEDRVRFDGFGCH